ncbi:MAG: hypothetical protein RR262_01145 [Clostridium sp.]
MKKAIGWIVLILFSISIIFFTNKNNKQYSITCNDKDVKVELKYKGLESAVDFIKDEKNNYYIAFKDKIVVIEENGKSYVLLQDNDFNIGSLEYFNNNLYIATKDKIIAYNINSKEQIECMSGIPNYGDYTKTLIRARGEYLFITVGAATNSGIVGEDNTWLKDYPNHHDVTPKKITLQGINFGPSNTGAFVPNNTSNIKGQTIEGNKIGTSSVIIYNLNTKAYETFAWGIRNINGLDFSSEGKLYATVGGIENRGFRPVLNDSDYIYDIKKEVWHGFPDFSGGDPVTSPRFADAKNDTNSFLLEKHPTNNPPAPVYQHDDVSTLGPLCIDSKGILGNKDKIYFYDKNNNKILSYTIKETSKDFIDLGEKSNIASMKMVNDQLIILENNEGILYSASFKDGDTSSYMRNNLYISLLVLTITFIISIILLLLKKQSK